MECGAYTLSLKAGFNSGVEWVYLQALLTHCLAVSPFLSPKQRPPFIAISWKSCLKDHLDALSFASFYNSRRWLTGSFSAEDDVSCDCDVHLCRCERGIPTRWVRHCSYAATGNSVHHKHTSV